MKLIKFVKDLMMDAGLPEESADVFADSLVFADMRGISSHGVTRLAIYRKRLLTGQVSAKDEPEITASRLSLIHVDGHNTMGAPLAMWAMKECIERAETTGACFA
ncbi:MAG: Ldh family oxidoreductase, partial [Eubacteriales bacterium]|nr:Ldh family oxidoreductase [Eubacteriales bacterium]